MTAFVKYGQFLIFILQVYAPSNNHPVQVYRKFSDHLRAIISMYCHELVVVLGDFNVHLQGEQYKPTDDSRSNLIDLMNYHNPVGLNTLPLCSCAAVSFFMTGTTSHLLIAYFFPVESLDTTSR